jgi:hypothetical protein
VAVLPESISALPPWLLVGVASSAAGILLVAGIFVAGDRLFPAPPTGGTRVDGLGRRRAEIRTYLDTVGERYVEDADVDGERPAFFLPERNVAITFDPQAYFRIRRGDTAAVLCEHEMPAAALGRRLPFDVEDGRVTDAADPVAAAFAHLGVDPDADPETVTSAYRSRVKEVHPDHGGDPEAFQRLHDAYTTAKAHAE